MYELQVEGMTCGGCANSVKRSIQAIDSQAKVDVDLGSQKIRVDSSADIKEVAAAVAEAGFPVSSTNSI